MRGRRLRQEAGRPARRGPGACRARYLVTGGTGLLGQHLVDELVTAFADMGSPALEFELSVTDPEAPAREPAARADHWMRMRPSKPSS